MQENLVHGGLVAVKIVCWKCEMNKLRKNSGKIKKHGSFGHLSYFILLLRGFGLFR